VGADGLEDVLDRHVAAAEAPRRDRAVVEHEPRHVEAGGGPPRRRGRRGGRSPSPAAAIVLSHPTRHTSPSKRWPRATSSIESAITSRETSESRIPSVPMATPSETEIVLNSSGVPPAARI